MDIFAIINNEILHNYSHFSYSLGLNLGMHITSNNFPIKRATLCDSKKGFLTKEDKTADNAKEGSL